MDKHHQREDENEAPMPSIIHDGSHDKTGEDPIDEEDLFDDPSVPIDYLIIGGGTASYSAIKEISDRDPKAKVRAQCNVIP